MFTGCDGTRYVNERGAAPRRINPGRAALLAGQVRRAAAHRVRSRTGHAADPARADP